MTIGSRLTAVHHSPMFSVTVTLCFIKLLHCFPGWPVPLSHKVPSQSDALYMVTLMKNATLRVMYSRRMLENVDGSRDKWLCVPASIFLPVLLALYWSWSEMLNLLTSTCFPFLGTTESWACMGLSAYIFAKCFHHGILLWVPSWLTISTTQLGKAAKKSELLECLGPRNITLRGSSVRARMSL